MTIFDSEICCSVLHEAVVSVPHISSNNDLNIRQESKRALTVMRMNRLAMKNSCRKLLILLLTLSVYACSSSAPQRQSSQSNATDLPFANDIADEAVMGKWARSCALCHVTGEAGAPIAGDSAQWQRRLAQGEESILQRVLEGYNSMPPLGYCMSCEVKDFRAMVGFMAGINQ